MVHDCNPLDDLTQAADDRRGCVLSVSRRSEIPMPPLARPICSLAVLRSRDLHDLVRLSVPKRYTGRSSFAPAADVRRLPKGTKRDLILRKPRSSAESIHGISLATTDETTGRLRNHFTAYFLSRKRSRRLAHGVFFEQRAIFQETREQSRQR